MKIMDLIKNKQADLKGQKSVTIAFIGDSVTQGCFDCYIIPEQNKIQTFFDYKSAYSTRLKEILNLLYPTVQINIINSGISGDCAANGVNRLERDVLAFNPDLVVVSYGLNDVGNFTKEEYCNNLAEIFKSLKQKSIETIFLTQNFAASQISPHLKDKILLEFAERYVNTVQANKKLKSYFEGAKSLCSDYGVKVCDLFAKWEKMSENGVNTTELLSNKINHPIEEIHWYMAIKLIETMFEC